MNRYLLSILCGAAMAVASPASAQTADNIVNRYGPPTFTGGTVHTPAESFALYHQHAIDMLRVTQPMSTPIRTVYPNPSADITNVVLAANTIQPVTISLINMDGLLMRNFRFSAGYGSFQIDLSSLPAGVYALQVREQGRLPQTIQFLKR